MADEAVEQGVSMAENDIDSADMECRKYKYDVAFSFTAQDEAIAVALNDLIQDRMQTFLYSERQVEIAGTDGEESFGRAFGEESRIVVVLYRAEWGHTKWTRIEETAIRNRGFEEGHDFLMFIPVEKDVSLPKWFPKTRLWVGLDRWGIVGAASVIEARVQEAGGTPQEESVANRAVRLKRRKDAEERRRQFLDSMDGVNAAIAESRAVFKAIEDIAVDVKQESGFIQSTKCIDQRIEIAADAGFLSVHWNMQCLNMLSGSCLAVRLWSAEPGSRLMRTPKLIHKTKYTFDQDISGLAGWRHPDTDELLTSQRLADKCLHSLIEYSAAGPYDHDSDDEDDEDTSRRLY